MFSTSTFSVFADYNQFFLFDAVIQPPYPETIPESALKEKFQLLPNLLAIYTDSSGYVSVKVTTSEIDNKIDSETWHNIAFGNISVPSGSLILAGCTDYLPSCPRIKVPSGNCSFFLASRGLGEVEQEQYWISIWPTS